MQIYLSLPVIGADTEKDTRKKILDHIKELGHSVVVNDNRKRKENFIKGYEQVNEIISASDVVIADFTTESIGVEYETSFALSRGKQVLALYPEGKKDHVEGLIGARKARRITVVAYNDITLPDILEEFCEKADRNLDAKLFMIIPPRIDQYLNWVVARGKSSKSDIIRAGVDLIIEEDEEYQEHLKKLKE